MYTKNLTLYVKDSSPGKMIVIDTPFLAGKFLFIGEDGTLTDEKPRYFTSVEEVDELLKEKFPNVRVVWKREQDRNWREV
jgi:histidinol phosphatase-like enzyme